MSERRAGLENDNARAEPAAKERRPPLAPEVSNTRTGPSRRGSDVDMRAKDLRVNTGNPAWSGDRGKAGANGYRGASKAAVPRSHAMEPAWRSRSKSQSGRKQVNQRWSR